MVTKLKNLREKNMLLYRLKSNLDGSYYQSERTFPGQVTTSEIWASKGKLYHFLICLHVSTLQMYNDFYVVERQNTRTETLKRYKITEFFNFFLRENKQ